MLSEKNTLRRLSLLRFTGCRPWSSGQRPFCSSASTSVPGAAAESLATRSQERASNDGAEIRAPGAVAVALLATCQPPVPRSVTSLAPVPASAGKAFGAALRVVAVTVAAWVAGAPGVSQTSDVAAQAIEAHRASGVRGNRFTAGNS